MDDGQRTTDNGIRTHPTFNFQLSTSAVRRPLTVVRCHLSIRQAFHRNYAGRRK